MAILRALWNGLKGLAGLVVPVFGKARGAGRQIRWIIHFLFLAVILVGLAYLNYKLDVGRLLGHAPSAFFRQIWLPLLFLLFYFLAWLGWWLWRLLRSPEDASDFPDIDAAWEEAKVALDRASIELTEVPLFLILGRPASGMAGLFEAARLSLTVDAVPRRPDAPVQVHANADAIYVSCTGASLLGRQAAILADELGEELTVPEPASAAGRSLSPVGRPQLREPADASGDSSTGVAVAETPAVEPGTRARRRRTALLKDAAEVERLTARLKHLCRLIARDRRPHCPLNGILLVVPFAATAADEDANQTGAICRADLAAARAVLQVHCPHVVLLADMEKTPGFAEFAERFPRERRDWRLGQRFPFLADADPVAVPELIASGVRWICQALFPPLVYRLFRLESAGRHDLPAVVEGNAGLYYLLGQMQLCERRLSRLLTLAFVPEQRGPLLLDGCYLAGTGRGGRHDQAFVPGVFRRLLECQNAVSWTTDALAADAACRRGARIGALGLALLLIL